MGHHPPDPTSRTCRSHWQEANRILCYSFWPADGVERIINLRNRVRTRLRQNAEVVGTDEAFFEDEANDQAVRDLFTEKSGILDGDDDREVDLASRALEIWKKALNTIPRWRPASPTCRPYRSQQRDSRSPRPGRGCAGLHAHRDG